MGGSSLTHPSRNSIIASIKLCYAIMISTIYTFARMLFFINKFINYTVNSGVQDIYIDILATFSPGVTIFSTYFAK